MQTIRTKYLSATNTQPQRIKAQNSGGTDSITLSIHHDLFNKVFDVQDARASTIHDLEMHRLIALELMKKLDWKGMMIGGADDPKGGMVWVFHTMQEHLSPTIFRPGAKW